MQIGLTSYSLGNSLPVLPKQVAAILRKYGSDAHLYMPGPGVPVLGPELVVNGGFDTDTGWTKQTGWTISGGLGWAASVPAYNSLIQSIPLQAGKSYLVSYNVVSLSSGTIYPAFLGAGQVSGVARSAIGPYSDVLAANGHNELRMQAGGSGFTGAIDNISVKEVTGYTNQVSGFTSGNYLESTGQTLASVDGAVGLVLDAAGSVGAELVVNGTGDSTAGWTTQNVTLSTDAGRFKLTAAAQPGYARLPISVQAGKQYRIEFKAEINDSSAVTDVIRVSLNNSAFVGASLNVLPSSGYATRAEVFTAAANATSLEVVVYGAADTVAYIDNISVKEITGIRATQATTANKPTVRRGIVNLLTYSNDLTNGVWNVAAVSKTVNRITPDATSALHRVFHGSITIVSGAPYTSAVVAKADGYRYLYVNGAASGGKGQVCFDLQTGTVAATAEGVGTIAATGDGSYLCCVSSTSASTSNVLYLQVNNSANAYDTTFAGDGTSGIYCYASGLFQGTLTADQIIAAGGIPLTTTAPASSARGAYALEFVASGLRRMDLGSVPFGMADDHVVVASGRCNSATGRQVIFAIRAASVANPIVCEVAFNSGYPQARWRNDAGTALSLQSPTAIVGQNCVIRAVAQGGTGYLYVNGVLVGSALLPGGATTVNMATIGAASNGVGGYGDFLDGSLVELTPIKGQLSAADAKSIEKYHGSLAGVPIP